MWVVSEVSEDGSHPIRVRQGGHAPSKFAHSGVPGERRHRLSARVSSSLLGDPTARPGVLWRRAPFHTRCRIARPRPEPASIDPSETAVSVTGMVAYDEERVAAMVAPVRGRVLHLLAAQGDHVERGQDLAVISSPDAASMSAGLLQARARRLAALRTLQRAEAVAAQGAGSQQELVEARSAFAQAGAEETRADATLRSMGAHGPMAPTYTLHSPIAGTIMQRTLRQGTDVRPDAHEPAFIIADLEHLWVLAHLHESMAATVNLGDTAEIETASLPGRRFTGTVQYVSDAIDPVSQTLVVRIGLANPGRFLRPDMFARVTLHTHPSGRIVLPNSALVLLPDGEGVFVETAPGHYDRRHVTLGAEIDGRVQVLSGVTPGERVVVQGVMLLDPSAAQPL